MMTILTLGTAILAAAAAIYLAIQVVQMLVRLLLIGGAVALIYFYVFPHIERFL